MSSARRLEHTALMRLAVEIDRLDQLESFAQLDSAASHVDLTISWDVGRGHEGYTAVREAFEALVGEHFPEILQVALRRQRLKVLDCRATARSLNTDAEAMR